MAVVLIIVGIVVVGLVAYLTWLSDKKRREALAALAKRLSWFFIPGHDRSHDEQYAHFEIFRQGHSRTAYNTLTGGVEIEGRHCPAMMGDFRYRVTRYSGKSSSSTTYRFSYLILHLPFAQVPDLLIRREGLFDKLTDAFGFDDIDFESAEFSRRFHVKSPDKRFAYDVIHPQMMQFLMTHDAGAIDIEYGRCCVSDGRHRWEPQEFEGRLWWIRQFFDLWPKHLTTQLAG